MDYLFLRIIRQWIPIAVAVSAITFIIYLSVQQDIRMGANEPQISMAEDFASILNSGRPATITGSIDVAHDLLPFTILYDKQGHVIKSNAVLNRKTPVIPMGVLEGTVKDGMGTKKPGENRVTWQPQEGVRLATVVVSYNNGYVLVGRNLAEIEMQEDEQLVNILAGWFVALIATFSSVFVMQTFLKGKK